MPNAVRIDEIYLAALELPPGEPRSAYLDRVCAGEPALRQRVERYLEAQPELGSFLEAPAIPLSSTLLHQPVLDGVGTQIGSYKLRELLGEGGFGLVYVAEQERPIRRKVALKVIKPGMDSKEIIARFEAERQALALMDHSNIAKVHDAGTTETGRPFFVMELVRGLPITDYCDQAKLPLRERLKLFITVCQAVQHAHQKGIIHRDLKPSNVMITLHDGVPVPKVIDFGVAKALNQRLTEHSLYTRHAQMLGTPMYMSPEQAELSGLDVDTRSDVYALGVLLYELLTGQTPFDRETFRKLGYDELRRMVREVEPPRPSARVSTLAGESRSTVASRRGIDERHHSRTLKGELDWIVMKALEKDRTRRYGSADALAADLERYLDDQPVQACPPSIAYRLRKFARRKRGLLLTLAVLAVCLPLAAIGVHALTQSLSGIPQQPNVPQSDPQPGAATAQLPLALASGRMLPGLVPDPTWIPDVGRWQLITTKPRGVIRSATWSPDESLIALAEANHVRIYDAHNLALANVLIAHSQPVRSVAWHPDGRRLASCSEDGTVRLWTIEGRPTHLLEGHATTVYQVAWRPDGSQLASCGADGTVRVWSPDGESIHVFDEGERHVFGIDWSPDGQLLASVGGDIWPAGPDGDPGDNALRIWDPNSDKLISRIPASVKHSGLCVDWRPDGQQIGVGYGAIYRSPQPAFPNSGDDAGLPDAGVRIWNIDGTPGPVVGNEFGTVSVAAWNPNGSRLAFGGRTGVVRVWNADDSTVSDAPPARGKDLSGIYWRRDGSGLLATDRNSVYESELAKDETPIILGLDATSTGFTRVQWSPDGQMVVGNGALFLDVKGEQCAAPRPPENGPPAWWAYDRQTIRPDGTKAPALEGTPPAMRRWAWSTRGWLAGASWVDASVRVWNDQGKLVATLKGHRGGVESVSWSPDGDWLASGGGDSVRIWKADGTPGPVMTGHTDEVYGVAWSPDGQWIASGSSDSTIRLWKPDGTPGPVLHGHQGCVHDVAWRPDSRKLVSGGWLDGTLRVWDIATERTEWQVLRFDNETTITLGPSGFPVEGNADSLESSLLYAVERRDGTMRLMTPSEFRKQHAVHFLPALAKRLAELLEPHDLDGAERLLEQVLTLRDDVTPKNCLQIAQMTRQVARASLYDGELERAESTTRSAIDIEEQVVVDMPEHDAAASQLAVDCFDLGQVLTAAGRNSEALAAYTKAIEGLQGFIEAQRVLAYVGNTVLTQPVRGGTGATRTASGGSTAGSGTRMPDASAP